MKKVLTYHEMQDLFNCNLYLFDGNLAMPNYRYCREDAPIYLWTETPDTARFELMTPENAPETDYSGYHRDA